MKLNMKYIKLKYVDLIPNFLPFNRFLTARSDVFALARLAKLNKLIVRLKPDH